MTHGTYEFALTLPLTQSACQTAQLFANQQPSPQKAEQVRLNTLAVLAVQNYLELMEIPTDLAASDSWNPIMRVCADVADLELPEKGRLECRPVKPGATVCLVPPETWEDRVGYVAVQVDESSREAHILGFAPVIETEELPLSELRSPEALLDHLFDLQQGAIKEQAQSISLRPAVAAVGQRLAHLGQWLQGAIDEGWQTVEEVLSASQFNPQLRPAYAFRNRGPAVRQARRLELGNGKPAIALVVEIRPETEQREIRLQLHPSQTEPNLPAGLQMQILDAAGTPVIGAVALGTEDFLELQIDGEPGEQFSVEILLNDTRLTQEFVI